MVFLLIALSTFSHPALLASVSALFLFFSSRGHMALWFIQLELISMLSIYFLFVEACLSSAVMFSLMMLFTVLASEGAVSLALIVNSARTISSELQKCKF